MQFLVYGEDSFRSRRKLTAIRERFSATRDSSGLNSSTYTAAQLDAAIESIRTAPFLAEKKMVVLDGFLQASADVQATIGEAVASKPESTVIVYFEDGGAEALAKSSLFAALKAQKFTEEFPPLSGLAAERFVADEAAAAGAAFEPRAARLLVELLGGDSWQLSLETAKLSAYAAGSAGGAAGAKITEAVVRDLVSDGREEPIFAFLDACADGRGAEATAMLERLLRGGASEPQIIAMLSKQFRAALAARDLIDRGVADAGVLARSIGLHPYAASKALAFARRHSTAALAARYDRLVVMEKAFKSGGPAPKITLTLFAAEPALA